MPTHASTRLSLKKWSLFIHAEKTVEKDANNSNVKVGE